MPRLVVEKGPDKGKFIRIAGTGTYTVGRETTAQIRLADTMASRLHFKIESRSDGYYILDLNSRNGTFVNGQRIKERPLKIGDKIQVGETLFSFLGDVKEERYALIGQTIGGYKVIERLGRGGMGTVYKAEQLSLNRIVALKLLSAELVKDKTFINLFVQEARAVAQLNHPNIVQVYDVSKGTMPAHKEEEVYYFSMEFVPGGSIQDRLAKGKKLPLEEALNIILHSARGLEYAEKKGIVHCDIKPDNLMIGEENVVKIGDLGLARSIKTPRADQTGEGVFGTPHYVAPERALGKAIDHRVDIYSLGSSFYRMLAGVTPYSGSSIQEIITKKVREDPRSLKQIDSSLPDSLCAVVEKMLARNPDERYQTATQVMADLNKVKTGLSAVAPFPKDAVADESIVTEKTIFDKVIIPLILVLLSCVSLFAIVGYYYEEVKPEPPIEESSLELDKPDQTPVQSSDYEETLATEYFKKAEGFVNQQENLTNPVILEEAIALYQKIIDKCPNSNMIPKAQAKINGFQMLLIQLEKERQQKFREAEATREFDKLIKNLTREHRDIINNVQLTKVDQFLNSLFEQLKEFKNQYKDTTLVIRAEKKIEELTTWQERFEKARYVYRDTEQKVRLTIVQRDFESALKFLDDFAHNEKYHNTLYDSLARFKLESVKKKAYDDYRRIISEVHDFVKRNNLDEAQRLLKEASFRYGIPEIENKIAKELDDLERNIEAKQEGEYKQLLQADREIFYPPFVKALETVSQGSFKKAVSILQDIQPNLRTKEYQTKLKDTIYEIESEQAIINVLKRHINQLNINVRELGEYSIKSANDQGITVAFSSTGTRTFAWCEITPKEFYHLITRGWNLSAEECLQLSILILRRGGTIDMVQKLLQQAKSKLKQPVPTEDQLIASLINKYTLSLRNEMTNREKEANLIYEYANECSQAKQYAKALDGFLALKHRFQNTTLYNRNKREINDKITVCRRNKSK